MTILGIDPGETVTGFGVVEKSGSRLSLVASGCIRIPRTHGTDAERLNELHRSIAALIEKHRPNVAAVEKLFFATNAKTAMRVAQGRGVALAACAERCLVVLEFTPLQIKQAVTGYGRAEKRQVQKMVGTILGLTGPLLEDDAADAVAAAICASTHSELRALTRTPGQ